MGNNNSTFDINRSIKVAKANVPKERYDDWWGRNIHNLFVIQVKKEKKEIKKTIFNVFERENWLI